MADHDDAPMGEPLRIGVMGAGAVGMFFAARLARAGAQVTAVARPAHVEAVRQHGLQVSSVDGADVVQFEVDTDSHALRDCDAVLVSVKTVDTDATGEVLASILRSDALVVSLQNGVDNAWRLRGRMPQAVAPGVVYVSVEMTGAGRLRHNGGGRLVVGAPLVDGEGRAAAATARLDALVACFTRAGVPCQVSPDVRVDLWTKLAANCAYNAVSALSAQRYGRLVSDAGIRAVMDLVTDEIAAVAVADGIPVTRAALAHAVAAIAKVMPQALSSTAQDIQAGRRTEIDDLNGFVVRRGAARGVPTPVNRTLQALVKFVEDSRQAP